MKISIAADDRVLNVEVEPDEQVENVKAIIEVEMQVPIVNQRLFLNGRELPNASHLNRAGVREGDLLLLQAIESGSSRPQRRGGGDPNLAMNPDGSAVNPIALQRHLRQDQNLMRRLLETDPSFAHAVLGDDIDVFQRTLRDHHRRTLEAELAREREIELLEADPFNPEAQRKIEEVIRQKQIDENMEAAIEHNPEAFGRVVMLYVDAEVNRVPLKAFVDSGAQSTIMSLTCAERCGIARLMDKRFSGIAKGVGTGRIMGRVHVAPLKLGDNYYPCSFTIIDQPDVEFLFGLDMLRKHQCQIDLKANVLRVGGGEVEVPFLQEKDLPPHLRGSEISDDLPHQMAPSSSTASPQRPQPALAQGVASAAVRHVPAAAAPPSPVRPASSPSGPPSTQSSMEEKIARLKELGFDHDAVVEALTLFAGNEQAAASFLFGG